MRAQEQINFIMEDCDFNKIHSVMTFLKWKWKIGGKPAAVPTVEEIKATAQSLLTTASNSTSHQDIFSYDGLEVVKIDNTLELRFVTVCVNPLSHILNSNPGQ